MDLVPGMKRGVVYKGGKVDILDTMMKMLKAAEKGGRPAIVKKMKKPKKARKGRYMKKMIVGPQGVKMYKQSCCGKCAGRK